MGKGTRMGLRALPGASIRILAEKGGWGSLPGSRRAAATINAESRTKQLCTQRPEALFVAQARNKNTHTHTQLFLLPQSARLQLTLNMLFSFSFITKEDKATESQRTPEGGVGGWGGEDI